MSYPINELSKETGLTIDFMKSNDYVYWREIDGIVYAVSPMTFGKGRLMVDCNRFGYEDFYCFLSVEDAVNGLDNFQGEDGPEVTGWHRHYKTGRRRENANPLKETIND